MKQLYFWQVDAKTVTSARVANGVVRIEYDGTIYPESGPVIDDPQAPALPPLSLKPGNRPVIEHHEITGAKDATKK